MYLTYDCVSYRGVFLLKFYGIYFFYCYYYYYYCYYYYYHHHYHQHYYHHHPHIRDINHESRI